jgi:hypothetical protein
VIDDARRVFAAPGRSRLGLRMELDVRHSGRADAVVTAEPSDLDIARALGLLDQDQHTELALVDDDGSYMIVNGGLAQYHVYIGVINEDDRIVLQSPVGGEGSVELSVSGRRATYPAGEVVGLGLAAAAIAEFLRSGRPHPGLAWRTG